MNFPGTMIVLAAILLAAPPPRPSCAQSSTGRDGEEQGKLSPFKWEKPAPVKQAPQAGPKLVPVTAPAESDELVCEKDVVHPSPAPADMKAAIVESMGNVSMGHQHCWRKSNPSKVMDRPMNLMDPMVGAIKDAGNSGFPPLRKPQPAAKKKPAKTGKTKPAAEKPAAEPVGTPRILRDE